MTLVKRNIVKTAKAATINIVAKHGRVLTEVDSK